MSKKQFLITYPDGSRKHVGRVERDSLLLSCDIKQVRDSNYSFTGQAMSFHAFAELGKLRNRFEIKEFAHYLRGTFVFETPNRPERPRRRIFERMETPESLAIRVTKQMQEASA